MDKLIRNGSHQRPMLAVLERYGIGCPDKYGRGRWIAEKDLPAIAAGMKKDPTRGSVTQCGMTLEFVQGSNRHNSVTLADFAELFGEVR